MKKVFKLILIIVLFTLALNIVGVTKSEASVKSSVQISSVSSDFIIFIRVQEGNRRYVYIYTEGGIYISKFEEL